MSGEYEPNDSRNVTGANAENAQPNDGRWSNDAARPQAASGQPQATGQSQQQDARAQGQQGGYAEDGGRDPLASNEAESENAVQFQPDAQLDQDVERAAGGGEPGTFTGPSGGQAGNSQAGSSGGVDSTLGTGGVQSDTGASMGQSSEQGWPAEGGTLGADEDGSDIGSQYAGQIREHMRVVGPDGEAIGTVDSVEGERIKLTRSGSADGEHHYIEMSEIESVDEDEVALNEAPDFSGSMSGER